MAEFPDRSNEIAFHSANAHRAVKEGNFEMARVSFLKWVESVRQNNRDSGGAQADELAAVQREYSEFVKGDPLYLKVCTAVLPAIRARPGLLQTDLYKQFPHIDKGDISYALYFAAEQGKICRVKKGRTYSLSIA